MYSKTNSTPRAGRYAGGEKVFNTATYEQSVTQYYAVVRKYGPLSAFFLNLRMVGVNRVYMAFKNNHHKRLTIYFYPSSTFVYSQYMRARGRLPIPSLRTPPDRLIPQLTSEEQGQLLNEHLLQLGRIIVQSCQVRIRLHHHRQLHPNTRTKKQTANKRHAISKRHKPTQKTQKRGTDPWQ